MTVKKTITVLALLGMAFSNQINAVCFPNGTKLGGIIAENEAAAKCGEKPVSVGGSRSLEYFGCVQKLCSESCKSSCDSEERASDPKLPGDLTSCVSQCLNVLR